MKKTKILSIVTVLFAMVLSGCNKNKSSSSSSSSVEPEPTSSTEPAPTSSSSDSSSSEHTHAAAPDAEWQSNETEHWKLCAAGDNAKVERGNHSWGNPTDVVNPTCTEAGSQKVACTVCGYTKTEVLPPAHTWGDAVEVAGSGEKVGYRKSICSVTECGAIRLEIRALDGTLATGSALKDGTKEGFMKLKSDGHKISYTFDYPDAFAEGKIYQRGFMDSWSNNTNRTFFSGQNGHTSETQGNFNMRLNNVLIDYSDKKDVKFSDVLVGDNADTEKNYSPIADVEVGAIELNKGTNVLEFERVDSFNLVISDFVIVVKNSDHEHVADTEWHTDGTQHWHECVDGDGYKFNAENHTWGERFDVVDSTCAAEGSYKHTCTVCGKTVEEVIEKKAHDWNDWAADGEPATCSHGGQEKRTCKNCDAFETRDTKKLAHSYTTRKLVAASANGIAYKALECGACNEGAIEFSALDYDTTLSVETAKTTGEDGVLFNKADKCNPGNQSTQPSYGADVQGTKYVYKIDSYAAAENAVLSFDIKTNSQKVEVFKGKSGDWTPGYVQSGEEWVKSPFRYGLKVNGVDVQLGADTEQVNGGTRGWFEFNATFALQAGVNTIELLCLGGYPAQGVYNYRIGGLPLIEVAHIHSYSEWTADGATGHYRTRTCDPTDENCDYKDDPVDQHYDAAAHTYGSYAADEAATCTSRGTEKHACTVCGYEEVRNTRPLAHDLDAGTTKKNSDGKDVKIRTCSVGGEKVISVAMNQISAAYRTTRTSAAQTLPEVFALGDAVTLTNTSGKDGTDGNLTVGNEYKLAKGVAIAFKVNLTQAIAGAHLEVGGKKMTSNTDRYFKNHALYDIAQGSQNPDTTSQDYWRYYTKVNDGEFVHVDEEDRYADVLGQDTNVIILGTFDLQAGENIIYIRQADIGYRATINGELRICYTGEDVLEDAHVHDWVLQSDTATCTAAGEKTYHCAGCGQDKVEASPALGHLPEDGDWTVVSAATCTEDAVETKVCARCGETVYNPNPTKATGHTWGDPGEKIGGAAPRTCSICSAKCYDLAISDTTSGLHAAGKFKDTNAVWNIEGIEAGTYEIQVNAGIGNGNVGNAGFADDNGSTGGEGSKARYQWRVDEEAWVDPTTGNDKYADSGVKNSGSSYSWTKTVATIVISGTAATFEMRYCASGFSLNVSDVRLVKVA